MTQDKTDCILLLPREELHFKEKRCTAIHHCFLCSSVFFSACLVCKVFFFSFHRLHWFYLTVLTPQPLFTDFTVRHLTTYVSVINNSMSSLLFWYCLCKIDCWISLAASEELLEKQHLSGSCLVPALKKIEKDALDMRIVSWQQMLKKYSAFNNLLTKK